MGGCGRWEIFLLFPPFCAVAQEKLYLVNTPDLVCMGAKTTTVELMPPAQNSNMPHIVTFFRTSPLEVKVRYQVRSAKGIITPPADTMLALHSTDRRLDESVAEARDNCEDFFLMDGRDPVELPDTWGEARAIFKEMCEDAFEDRAAGARCHESEQAAFQGYPEGQELLEADEDLCQRLLRLGFHWLTGSEFTGSRLPPYVARRRLKSGALGVASYGYSPSRLSAGYPAGHMSTAYGFTGRAPVAAFWYVVVLASAYRFGRHTTHCNGDQCQLGGDGMGQCEVRSDPCRWELAAGEEMLRDDITSFEIIPAETPGPYYVDFFSVSSPDYSMKICPPSWWDFNTSRWSPPPRQDLFVSLQSLEQVVDTKALAIMIGCVALLVSALCYCGIYLLCDRLARLKLRRARREMREKEQQAEADFDKQLGMPNMSPVHGYAMLDSDSVSLGKDFEQMRKRRLQDSSNFIVMSASLRHVPSALLLLEKIQGMQTTGQYKFAVASDSGAVSGTVTRSGQVNIMQGIVRPLDHSPDAFHMRWGDSGSAGDVEGVAILRSVSENCWTAEGSFAAMWNRAVMSSPDSGTILLDDPRGFGVPGQVPAVLGMPSEKHSIGKVDKD